MYTILYVDDEPVLLDVGKHFLERSGEFRVDIITSAPVALTLLNEKAYDAIISDYQMPDMDGIEFLKKIRSSGNAIPFILFTGRGREEVVIQALNEGADFYLQKGGEPKSQFAELSNKIRYSVTRRRAEDALKLERGELLKKNEELNASYEQITAIEEELRSNLDDLAHQGQVIRESEERYRNVVEDQTEFISRFKPDGTHVFANEAYCRYFGLKREEIVGHRFRPKIPVEDRGSVKRFFESLTPDHPVDSIEHRIIMSDGSICWQRWSDRAIFDKNGHIREYQSVGRDTTDKKNAENELRAAYEQITATEEELRAQYDELKYHEQVIRESEERYRNVVEDQTEFISRFKPDGTHVFVNEAYCRYFGLKREEIVGHRFRPKIPVEDQEIVKRFFEYLTPDHPVDSIEHRIIMSDGSICWQRWSDRIIFDKNGRIAEYQSVGADITEQKNAEEKLRSTHDELNAAYEQLTATEEELRQNYDELNRNQQALVKSEERYRNVVEDQTEFICRFGPDGTHVFINEAYCRYFDMRREEIMGHRFRPKIPVEDQDLVKRFFKSLTPDRPVDSVEHRIIMPDGSIRWQRWSDRAIFDKNGHIREYQSVGRDTTDKKNAENELRAAYEQITAAEEELRAQYDELKDREQVIRESEQKLQGIVQGSPIPQFVLDENQRVISWNRALEEYSGVKAKEVLGTTHAWKAFYDRERPVLSNLLMKDTPEKIQELYAGKFNKSKYVDGAYEATDFFPRMGGHGIWLHFTAALIRDSKGDIIGAVETLEDITERTRADEELRISYEQITASEEELRHQFDELKKSEDALRQSNKKFNLLSGITWHDITNQLTLLEAYITLINEQQPDLSSNEYFKRATLSIQRITTMIQFSKEYENIGVKDPLWQNCHTLVDAATKQILFGDPVVKNDLPAGAEVFADPLVFEVFYNLIDNAVRHGMEITTIRFSVENRDGSQIIVCEDDGVGIPVNEKEMIFGQGFGRNTGMGLFLAREILNITGITIRETGEPDKGARFELTVPKEAYRSFNAK